MVRFIKSICISYPVFFAYSGIFSSCLFFSFLSCNTFFPTFGPQPDTPIVVITFDDADESVFTKGFMMMRETDSEWTATHFFPESYLGQNGFITLDQELEMERHGWESGGHGFTHTNLTAVPSETAAVMIQKNYEFLVRSGLSHESFAFASGMYNDSIKSLTAKYFVNIRTGHDFYYLNGVDRKNLGYFAVKEGFTSDDIVARVEDAKRLGAPLVVIGFHIIQPDTAPPLPVYWCKESAFRGFLSYLKKQHLRVMSIRDAMKILL